MCPHARLPTPQGVQLSTDVTPAEWLHERLLPIRGSGEGVLVGEIVPTGFDAYARILHPARHGVGDEERPLAWAEVAAQLGRVIHPEVQFESLIGKTALDDDEWDGGPPDEGSLPLALRAPLLEILSPFTTTPDHCWFCVWEGFGFWGSSSSGSLYRAEPAWRAALRRRAAARRAKAERRALAAIPRVSIQPMGPERIRLRSYFLFEGPIGAATTLEFDGWSQSPNLWWPEDRAWCVATEIDACSTYVGGTLRCIKGLLTSQDLEALPSSPDHRFDLGSDRVNSTPRDPP